MLEKTLLNIDLGKYACLLEVRHICETELLTSALIHILINEFDDDREVCYIFIIFNNRAQYVFNFYVHCIT